MRFSLLTLGLFCLFGCVYSTDEFRAGEFEEFAGLRTNEDDEESDQIVGGTAAKVGEFPYLAGLSLGNSLCGGSLIAPNIILTAAHCLYGKSASSVSTFKAILNSTSLDGGIGSVVKTIRKFVIHPKYSPTTQDNDVALLALTTPATGVKTVALPPAGSTETYAGKTAAIAGYGTTSAGGSISRNLLRANVIILTNTACSKQYNNINNNKICAAAPGKDTCQGDSGGPMVVNGVLVGVTSYGRGCANPKYAGVYARVTTYVSWIKTTQASI